MAADDLTGLQPSFRTLTITLPGADLAREVILPKWCRRISFRFETDAGKYSSEGTDGSTIDSDHQTATADTLHSISVDRAGRAGSNTGTPSIFFATATGSTVMRILLETSAS